WFRSMYPQGCGGSSPFFGTNSGRVLRSAQDFACGLPLRLRPQDGSSSSPFFGTNSGRALRPAQDFACGLPLRSRPQNGSSSSPFFGTSFDWSFFLTSQPGPVSHWALES